MIQSQTQILDNHQDRTAYISANSKGKPYCYPVKNPGGFLTRNTHKLKE